MKELYIIRHGEAEHHVGDEPLTGGWTDTRLTQHGIVQAEQAGKRLVRLLNGRMPVLLTSDLKRTMETAEIIGQYIGVKPVAEAALREFNNGVAAGMTQKEAKLIASPMLKPIASWRPYPGGENWLEFYERVRAFFDRHLTIDLAVIVCHAGTAFNLTFRYLGLENDHFGRLYTDLEPCGITHLHVSPYGEQCIHFLNDTAHLIYENDD